MTTAPTHIKGPVCVSSRSVHGPITASDARYSGLQRPILSESVPNRGDEITASSIGSVLTKPESVGSTPCCCMKVGANPSTARRVMLNTRNAAKNKRMFGRKSSA